VEGKFLACNAMHSLAVEILSYSAVKKSVCLFVGRRMYCGEMKSTSVKSSIN